VFSTNLPSFSLPPDLSSRISDLERSAASQAAELEQMRMSLKASCCACCVAFAVGGCCDVRVWLQAQAAAASSNLQRVLQDHVAASKAMQAAHDGEVGLMQQQAQLLQVRVAATPHVTRHISSFIIAPLPCSKQQKQQRSARRVCRSSCCSCRCVCLLLLLLLLHAAQAADTAAGIQSCC